MNTKHELHGCRFQPGRGRRPVLPALVIAVALAMSMSMVRSEEPGRCAVVEAPWPIVLPDGTVHDAGALKLCLQQMWTPATGLHEIRINGTSIGLFMSRAGNSESRTESSPVVIFDRNGKDEHYLLGYAWPDGEVMRTYALHKFGSTRDATARNLSLPLLDPANDHVLLAALAP